MADSASESYQRLVQEIYPRLVTEIQRRYQRNAWKSIGDVYRLDEDFISLEADNLAFTLDHRQEIATILADSKLLASLVRLFVLSTLEFTYANNQFIRVDAAGEKDLETIYRRYLIQMKSILAAEGTPAEIRTRLGNLVAAHFEDLQRNLSRYLDRPGLRAEEENAIFQRVVCREYSPAFQLEILGIDLNSIRQPVLDIGCGKSGRLVKYLNASGIDAFGVDRLVDPYERLTAADWLDYRIEPGRWGTILSHMAFSNHFIFQHLYKSGHPEPYARQYMAILAGLQPGGSFYYAPGLAFIETYLPAGRYTVTRRRVVTNALPRTIDGDGLEEDLLAVRVTLSQHPGK